VPIYEYRCPNGHVFELFKRMTDPAPEACEVCSASPVEIVLYPVAIHYKGSGFYTTDYGKGKRAASGDSGLSDSSKSDSKGDSKGDAKSDGGSAKPAEPKKAAEA
jgi:putative FmdB family regulatory protein